MCDCYAFVQEVAALIGSVGVLVKNAPRVKVWLKCKKARECGLFTLMSGL